MAVILLRTEHKAEITLPFRGRTAGGFRGTWWERSFLLKHEDFGHRRSSGESAYFVPAHRESGTRRRSLCQCRGGGNAFGPGKIPIPHSRLDATWKERGGTLP